MQGVIAQDANPNFLGLWALYKDSNPLSLFLSSTSTVFDTHLETLILFS